MTLAQRHGFAELFAMQYEPTDDERKQYISEILGREIDDTTFTDLQYSWKEFSRHPERYADTVVPLLVNQYLDERA